MEVKVIPDTGATIKLIPWSLVQRLNLHLETGDNNYELETASGDKMSVLGTAIIYLEPEDSDTRPVQGIVTDQTQAAWRQSPASANLKTRQM